jgi:hypothetical protein
MMRCRRRIPIAVVLLGTVFTLIHTPAVAGPPFSTGERLVYDIAWFGVSGGNTVMEVNVGMLEDRPTYHIASTTKSNAVISLFYPVDDFIEGHMDRETLIPYRMKSRIREGRYSANREILFDWDRNEATFINYKDGEKVVGKTNGQDTGKKKTSSVVLGSHDPLSVMYYFRTLPIEVGKKTEMDVFDGHKNWKVDMEVISREKVTTPLGEFSTFKTKTKMRYKGIFVNKGDVTVWFTDDERRIPVLMESQIKIGRITATLMEMNNR